MARIPKTVDFRAADDPRDVVHQIVQGLAEGELVGLPTETGYVAAAHALQPRGADRLARVRQHLGARRSVLALKNPLESLDYVPQMGDLGRKLIRRFWPGPVIGVLLTGMGRDGAEGLRLLHQHRHLTIAQDERSSAVYGMPKAAVELHAVTDILPIDKIGPRLRNIIAQSAKDHV